MFSCGMLLGTIHKPTANATKSGRDLPINLNVMDCILGNLVLGSQLLQLCSDELSSLLVNIGRQAIGSSVTFESNLRGLIGAILQDARAWTRLRILLWFVVGASGIIVAKWPSAPQE